MLFSFFLSSETQPDSVLNSEICWWAFERRRHGDQVATALPLSGERSVTHTHTHSDQLEPVTVLKFKIRENRQTCTKGQKTVAVKVPLPS